MQNNSKMNYLERFKLEWKLKIEESKLNRAWWTAFYFDFEPDPNSIHITHKFLGKLSMFESCAAEAAISKHFRRAGGFKPFPVAFDKVEWFGPNEDIRVLRPHDQVSFFHYYFDAQYHTLRTAINGLRRDEYLFNPHISTERPHVHGVLAGYALMHGQRIVRSWDAQGSTLHNR
jgi:hypothetical protein